MRQAFAPTGPFRRISALRFSPTRIALVCASIGVALAGAPGGNIVADPLFVDRIGHDYHLADGSPANDRAVPGYSAAFDYDGRIRPQGVQPDIGAFER
jgi:hypothetical protein